MMDLSPSQKRWGHLLLFALLARVVAWQFFESFEIVNDSGVAIKPLGTPAYLDYVLYRLNANSPWGAIGMPIKFIQKIMDDPLQAWEWLRHQPIKPGPLFTTLLSITGYDESRASLSWIYLASGLLLGMAWAKYLALRGLGLLPQVMAACFPALVYYSFLVSTDLLYGVFLAPLYVACWLAAGDNIRRSKVGLALPILWLTFLLLARPNGLSLIPIVCYVVFSRDDVSAGVKWILSFGFILVGIYFLIYYIPYFFVHEGNASRTAYFGVYPDQFWSGLPCAFGGIFCQILSVILLGLSKLLYSVGLRPSYAGITPWLVFLRALPGFLFLPGLIFLFLRGNKFDKIFMFFFLLPVYVGAAQERYLLPVTPVLLYYGLVAYRSIFSLSRDYFAKRRW